MKRLRVYADTSVFGGYFDSEFSVASRRFFEHVRAGKFVMVISATTLDELREAPEGVRQVLANVPSQFLETVERSPEVEELRDAYLRAQVVGPASLSDAEHIAYASVANAEAIVSWNFRHIVHLEKIRGYHSVNILLGYPLILICTPWEVIDP